MTRTMARMIRFSFQMQAHTYLYITNCKYAFVKCVIEVFFT